MTSISLAEFHKMNAPSRRAEIIGFRGATDVTERLQELGLRQGLVVEILGQAPFSGPGLYRIGSVVVALRLEEAACVSIQPVGVT